ncbi:M48 family metalloprotease [Sphingomonas psychrotolerans]|uniref:M48 family metalloprotease n=1 Tax=Sphingomonas psychrotolerans TaxID=1327635 RepID=A0ABU3MYT7_9SPHN|nr:M48 family metalloprotease [Sphingomonas psychrotolerans]MDT8757470.1 M48 family metalloprotease [Sphingomonas psychrotolerans]
MTLILPLAVLALGIWEQQRVPANQAENAATRAEVAAILADLEGKTKAAAAEGKIAFDAQLRIDGRVLVGEAAVGVVRDELNRLDRADRVERIRGYLPPVVIACAALVFAISLLMLLGSTALGWAGRQSRDALERGFSFVRRALPVLLGVQVVATALAIVAAVAFEVSPLAEAEKLGTRDMKLVLIAILVMGFSLWTAGKAVLNLRHTLALFEPDPLEIEGRSVSRAEAPGLWQWIDGIADRLGALRPDQIVVGLTRGFFVTSGPKLLLPGGERFEGRTLYLPLPYLPLLRQDEAEAIIGHELGHFTGGDTEYSLRFLPIYAGVNRSLAAMVLAGRGADGSDGWITRPAIELGIFVMDRFDRAVMHWSRIREFAADEAGARITSPEAQARALLRTDAVERRIAETLGAAFEHPENAPADLVAATVDWAREAGLDDPMETVEQQQPHPTDTHPPRHQRLAALGVTPGPALLAEVTTLPAEDALGRISALFAAPDQLFRDLSAAFIGRAHETRRAYRESLETAAGAVETETVVVQDSTRAGGWVLLVVGLLFAVVAIGIKVAEAQLPSDVVSLMWVVAGIALMFLVIGGALLVRGEKPFVTLHLDAILLDGLDRPLAWSEIEQVAYHAVGGGANSGGLRFSVFLTPDAALPGPAKGGRRVKINRKKRRIEIASRRFRKMTAQEFADLIERYRVADHARSLLERQDAAAA